MRKYIQISVFLLFAVAALCSCGTSPELSGENHVDSPAVSEPAVSGMSLVISVGGAGAVSVPNPETVGSTVKISLQEEGNRDKGDKYFMADLSFAGFSRPVYVSAFAVGARDDSDISAAQIRYLRTGETKTKRGSMLALLVSEQKEESGIDENEKNYLLVMDYGRHCFYKAPTSFFPHDEWDKMIKFKEMTGDDENEIMIKHCYNLSYSFSVYHFSRETGELTQVCSEESLDSRKAFSGHLEDDYKVVMEYRDIDYSETVSMLDAGYKKYMLEKSGAKKDVEGEYRFVRLWNNGKLQQDKLPADPVFVYTLDRVSVEDGSRYGFQEPLLVQMRWVCVGHRSEGIGKLYTYARWDEASGKFIFVKAAFVTHH